MGIFGIVGYTLNEDIVYNVIGINDAGGSMPIHTFGAYFGLTVCFILGKKVHVKKKVETTVFNSTFAMIGTLFLWMYWPSFNAGFFPENAFQKSLIVSNTIIALTGSCLATFITTALIHDKFSMEDILNATLAGGVAIGAPSGVVANPGIALTIGIVAGVISTIGFSKLNEALYKNIGLHDTCGVHNLHGIPGLIGGWTSAMVIASYQTSPGLDSKYQQYVNFTPN
jgi:ammonium transporter Rh